MSVNSLYYTSVLMVNSAAPFISSVSNITSGVLAMFCNDVEAEISAKISKRYALPLTPYSCPLLTAIATRETIYRVAVQRALIQFPPAQQGRAPLAVQHSDDQKMLADIAEGAIQLVTTSGTVVAADLTQSDIWSTTMGYVPTFSEGGEYDQIQDQDKINDDLSNRGL